MSRFPQLRRHAPKTASTTHAGDGARPRLRPREATDAQPRRASRLVRLLQPLPLLGLALVVIALVGYLAAYSSATQRTPVVALTRPLRAGSVLAPADLHAVRVAAPASVVAALEPATQLDQLIGKRLQQPVGAGVPLPRAALSASGRAASTFTLTVPALHAAGGLEPGDRVTVLATFGAGSGRARTRALARGLEVLAAGQPPANADPGTSTIPITVALPNPSLASSLALADEDAKIDLLREGQGAASAPIPQATDTGSAP